jgi:hypothetical protein
VFEAYNLEEEVLKMHGIGTFTKKVHICREHIERYNSFKKVKEMLKDEYIGSDNIYSNTIFNNII